MKIGIIGCGLIGKKRAASLRSQDKLVVVCDNNQQQASTLAQQYNTDMEDNWKNVLSYQPDAVVIATSHNSLTEITSFFLEQNIHVLVEKPAARNYDELYPINELYKTKKQQGVIARVGFNHRFHPALSKAKEILAKVKADDFLFIRGRYGHGGRPGYDQEWRARPQISGGGELLDQGMHLIDLSRWFFGEFPNVYGLAKTFFWDMPVDDNAFLTLETATGQVSQLHVTWTEWKNLFSFEIYTRTIKLHIEGLGGSYGVERLAYYQMKPEMGPPNTIIYEYPGTDLSWQNEWLDFVSAIESKEPGHGGTISDALASLKIVKTIYQQNPQISLESIK